MNSTLQCLLHIPELNNFFLKVYANQIDNFDPINKAAETGGKLSKGYLDLLMSVITENRETRSSKAVTPNCFHNIIGNLNPQFRTYDANDSKDLLLFCKLLFGVELFKLKFIFILFIGFKSILLTLGIV